MSIHQLKACTPSTLAQGSSPPLVGGKPVIDSQDHSQLSEFNIFLLLSSFESNTAIVETLAARRYRVEKTW